MAQKVNADLDFQGKAKLVRPVVAKIVPSVEGELGLSQDEFGGNTFAVFVNGANRNVVTDIDIVDGDLNLFNIPLSAFRVPTINSVKNYVAGTLASLGKFRGTYDASAGAIPTGTNKKAGDYWRVTVAGTLTGLTPNAQLQIGDVVYASIDNATAGADFFSVQANFASANDVVVGATFTPTPGIILGGDTVKLALEKLQSKIDALNTNASKSYTASVTLVANTPFTVTHNLNLANRNSAVCQVFVNNEVVIVDIASVDVNSLTITSTIAATAQVTVIGK
jgi:hypothetical protein